VALPLIRRALLVSIIITDTLQHARYALVGITALLLARHMGIGMLVPLAPIALPARQLIHHVKRVNIRATILIVVGAVQRAIIRPLIRNQAVLHVRV